MRYQAHFDPQAWQNDYANSVDAEGPQTWDCTAFILAEGLGERVDAACTSPISSVWFDTDDVLKGDENAPEWVREWDGPFTITVRQVSETE